MSADQTAREKVFPFSFAFFMSSENVRSTARGLVASQRSGWLSSGWWVVVKWFIWLVVIGWVDLVGKQRDLVAN